MFIAAWAVLGTVADGYSPVEDPISRLAGVDASTRWLMTLGFVGYAVGIGAFASAVGPVLGRGVAIAAGINAAAAIGVAATPVGSSLGGWPHAVAATIGYASLAAMPLLSSRSFRGRGGAVPIGYVVTAITGAALLMSAGDDLSGAWQRLGLTVGDLWLIGIGLALTGRHDDDHGPKEPVGDPVGSHRSVG